MVIIGKGINKMTRPKKINYEKDFKALQRISPKREYAEDEKLIKEVYNKIKELKEEIELTKNNNLINDEVKKAKYINTLNVELDKCYKELEFIEKMQDALNTRDIIDDYMDKKGSVKEIDFYYN